MVRKNMLSPIDLLSSWLLEEQNAGAPNPRQAILSTATKDSIPHARVVAVREINERGLLFFTQRGTRKVEELTANSQASMTFWFELYQRETIIEGVAEALTEEENNTHWQSYPREAQIRFYSYAPTSSQPISTKVVLENKRKQMEHEYKNKPIPLNPFYCGFRLKPIRIIFYSYRLDELSDVFEYKQSANGWMQQRLSP